MTLFNGVSWAEIQQMPIYQFNDILAWRVKYEAEKQRIMNETVSEQKEEIQKQNNMIKNK